MSNGSQSARRGNPDTSGLMKRVLDGDPQALGRAMSWVEDGSPTGREILHGLYRHSGRAHRVGVTGFPGAGKSCLVDGLTAVYREHGYRVGVVAVDPTSAFSGGAILGDRVRMMRHACDDGVFIRSLATRGQSGGLSKATHDVADLLDAAAYDRILIETVGVGQDEIGIIETADTVLVVLVPGLGDDIQAIKAGILEIADIFVINKADRPGADRLERELTAMLQLGPEDEAGPPPIVRTVATREEGLTDLLAAVDAHREGARASGREKARRRRQSERRFLTLLRQRLVEGALRRLGSAGAFHEVVSAIAERRIDPYAAVDRVLDEIQLGEEP